MRRWVWAVLVGVLVLLVGGCGFVMHPIKTLEAIVCGPEEVGTVGDSGSGVGASNAPFPWDWILGFAVLTALALGAARWLGLPFLREEILAAGVGLAAIRPILMLTHDLLAIWWQMALILATGVAAALGWKLLRRWLDKKRAE